MVGDQLTAAKTELAGTIATLESTLNTKIADLQSQITANDGDIAGIVDGIADINDLIDRL